MAITDEQRKKWRSAVKSVSKERQRKVITDAKDIGKLTYREIAEILELSEVRVKQIVQEVRQEREQENG